MSEEFTYWCIVCQEVKKFPHRASVVIASYDDGGWYCGYHTREEIEAAFLPTAFFDRGGRFYPRKGGDAHAPQEGKVQKDDQLKHPGAEALGETPETGSSYRSSKGRKKV